MDHLTSTTTSTTSSSNNNTEPSVTRQQAYSTRGKRQPPMTESQKEALMKPYITRNPEGLKGTFQVKVSQILEYRTTVLRGSKNQKNYLKKWLYAVYQRKYKMRPPAADKYLYNLIALRHCVLPIVLHPKKSNNLTFSYVVDGRQRIGTLTRFFNGKLKVTLDDGQGYTFGQLHPILQQWFLETPIMCEELQGYTDELAHDAFLDLNNIVVMTSGEKLHALDNGVGQLMNSSEKETLENLLIENSSGATGLKDRDQFEDRVLLLIDDVCQWKQQNVQAITKYAFQVQSIPVAEIRQIKQILAWMTQVLQQATKKRITLNKSDFTLLAHFAKLHRDQVDAVTFGELFNKHILQERHAKKNKSRSISPWFRKYTAASKSNRGKLSADAIARNCSLFLDMHVSSAAPEKSAGYDSVSESDDEDAWYGECVNDAVKRYGVAVVPDPVEQDELSFLDMDDSFSPAVPGDTGNQAEHESIAKLSAKSKIWKSSYDTVNNNKKKKQKKAAVLSPAAPRKSAPQNSSDCPPQRSNSLLKSLPVSRQRQIVELPVTQAQAKGSSSKEKKRKSQL